MMIRKIKKFLIGLGIAIVAFFGLTDGPVKDAVLGGFSNVRGISNLQRTENCATFAIPDAASKSINWGDSCVQALTLDSNLTISSFSNGALRGRLFLIVTKTATAAITWPSAVKWASVSSDAPTLSAVGEVDLLEFLSVSSGSYYGTIFKSANQ